MKKLLFIILLLLVFTPVFAEGAITEDNFGEVIAYYSTFIGVLSGVMAWIVGKMKKLNKNDGFTLNITLLSTIIAVVLSLGFSAYATIVIQWDWVLFGVGAVVLYFAQAGIALAGVKPILKLLTKDKKVVRK